MPLMRDKAEYWRDASLMLGLLVIGIMIALDLLARNAEDIYSLRFYTEAIGIWQYIVYLVGIPALSVGAMMVALRRLSF